MTEPVALIVDPSGSYGAELISYYWRQAGLRSVLAFPDRHSRQLAAITLPIDHSRAVAHRLQLPPIEDPAGAASHLVAQLSGRYDVRVVPTYVEHFVELTTAITAELGLGWNTPAQMVPMRDNYALKQLLRQRAPELRTNASMAVASPADVLAADPDVYRGFVLKPRAGIGNSDVLIRQWPPDSDELAAYFGGRSEATILEEFVEGEEFQVNGQVDAAGEPVTTAVYLTNRGQVGNRSNIARDYWTLPTSDPRFDALSDYAVAVMRAIGLVRTPFHMELKLDGEGPCLIEVGARFVDGGGLALDAWLHGPQCDLVAVAAHDWLTDQPRELRLDWRRYDSMHGGRIYGRSERRGRIRAVRGADALAASPGFRRWSKKPQPGQVVVPTIDTATTAWAFEIATTDQEQAQALARAADDTLELEFVEDGDIWELNLARARRGARLATSLVGSTWRGKGERR